MHVVKDLYSVATASRSEERFGALTGKGRQRSSEPPLVQTEHRAWTGFQGYQFRVLASNYVMAMAVKPAEPPALISRRALTCMTTRTGNPDSMAVHGTRFQHLYQHSSNYHLASASNSLLRPRPSALVATVKNATDWLYAELNPTTAYTPIFGGSRTPTMM